MPQFLLFWSRVFQHGRHVNVQSCANVCSCRSRDCRNLGVPQADGNLMTHAGEESARDCQLRDEAGFHSDLPDVFESEIIVKADFVCVSSLCSRTAATLVSGEFVPCVR
jgi:hypothetical protein